MFINNKMMLVTLFSALTVNFTAIKASCEFRARLLMGTEKSARFESRPSYSQLYEEMARIHGVSAADIKLIHGGKYLDNNSEIVPADLEYDAMHVVFTAEKREIASKAASLESMAREAIKAKARVHPFMSDPYFKELKRLERENRFYEVILKPLDERVVALQEIFDRLHMAPDPINLPFEEPK